MNENKESTENKSHGSRSDQTTASPGWRLRDFPKYFWASKETLGLSIKLSVTFKNTSSIFFLNKKWKGTERFHQFNFTKIFFFKHFSVISSKMETSVSMKTLHRIQTNGLKSFRSLSKRTCSAYFQLLFWNSIRVALHDSHKIIHLCITLPTQLILCLKTPRSLVSPDWSTSGSLLRGRTKNVWGTLPVKKLEAFRAA